jgi:hypothetical protein
VSDFKIHEVSMKVVIYGYFASSSGGELVGEPGETPTRPAARPAPTPFYSNRLEHTPDPERDASSAPESR